MAIERNLNIFISWSGRLALECTKVLREWLPKMFDHVDPWMSDSDIEAGDRSMDEIQSKLNESGFGIIVVTTENMGKPWLNFEAGALSKSFGDDTNRVVPLLVNFDDKYQLQGPINQFHAVMLDKEGASKLCDSISATIGLDRAITRARFDWAWQDLETGIANAKVIAGHQPELPEVDSKDLLKDLYGMVRSLQESQLRMEEKLHRPANRPVRAHVGPEISRAARSNWRKSVNSEADIRGVARVLASDVKPVREVVIRAGEAGEPPDLVVSFDDGAGLSSEEFNRLHSELRNYTDYRLVIGN